MLLKSNAFCDRIEEKERGQRAMKQIQNKILISQDRRSYFHSLCLEAMNKASHAGNAGIGTLAEKKMHAIIKRYLCADENLHEVGVFNTRYVSDVRIGNDIYEVQTGAFYPMKRKIAHYLENTDCTVTIVHPIVVNKWITWISPNEQEQAPYPRKKSPKHETPLALLPELYCLLPYLQHPHLKFRLLLIEAEDFRLQNQSSNNRKRESRLYERIPLSLLDDIQLNSPADFLSLLPNTLPKTFTVRQFSAQTKLRGRDAYSAVRALVGLGILFPTEPIGKAMAFTF